VKPECSGHDCKERDFGVCDVVAVTVLDVPCESCLNTLSTVLKEKVT
jgi:hypothetical protein